ncbi:patanin-like phospholipase domain-containing protein [Galendromus occidentalis]|uniref:Patanin-like phospholipase domain-containing protein n=1 Tax=Galendromus occidentalis TaxID=34638 RepID=A0AAJ6QSE7_9ACAR|nr:patanin-like phospholipase domain-containing protein [Galendromus occidentalis]
MARAHALAGPLLREEAHLSFSGGGFLGIYHVGVALAFRDFAPHIAKRKVLGTSSGALAAMCLVSDFPMDKAVNNIVKMAKHCRSLSLGPLHPKFNIFDIMRGDLETYMPEDAHIRSSGRLFVTVTNALTLESEIITNFESREELIDVLMASCFIPYFLGFVPPKVRNTRYIDGGISCNIPVLDQYTITVSPFPGESIIGPRFGNLPKVAFMPETALRLCKTVFAPPAYVLEELVHQGYDDAINFLQESKLISCSECLTQDVGTGSHRKRCEKCEELLRLSDITNVPRSLLRSLELTAMQEQEERRLHPYLHTSLARSMRIAVGVVVLPFEVSWAIARKMYETRELFLNIFLTVYRGFLDLIRGLGPAKDECRPCGPSRLEDSSKAASKDCEHRTCSKQDSGSRA